jgi:hypothetical protein
VFSDIFRQIYNPKIFFKKFILISSYLTLKENKTPCQLTGEKIPELSIEIAKLPLVNLCELLNKT